MTKKNNKFLEISKYYPLFFTIAFVFILFQYSFSTLEAIFYDLRVKYDFGVSYKDKVVMIVMDEESDEFLGETFPYTYASHFHTFEKLANDRPKVINYFVNLVEPQGELEQINLTRFKGMVSSYISGGGVFRFGVTRDAWGEKLPPKSLQSFGYSLSLINSDSSTFSRDDVVRRTILNYSGEDSLHLWTANEYRKTLGLREMSAKQFNGAYYLKEADATFALFRYPTSPIDGQTKIKKIPFHSVRVGNFPKGFFKDKIVLIGPSYISNASQYVLSPFDKEGYRTSKLSIHAEIILALIQGKTVYPISRVITYVLSTLLAIFLSFMISWLKPTHGLLMTVCMMIGVLIISYAMFIFGGFWLYTTHVVLTVFVVYYIWVPFRAIGEYQTRFAIQEETKLLKKVENLKQNFISLMSHDLKTPVAKIAGLADNMLVQRQYNSNAGEKNIRLILDSTVELNRFISGILDLAKIESRNLSLNISSKDINSTIEQVVEGLKFEANEKDINIETNLGPLYPIQYDQNLMFRVISNLIENAIKYSGHGSIINIETTDDDDWVYVIIKDNGVGIPESDLNNIFEKFYRVKNDAAHSIKGTGLGLFLVRYFIELHGGKIDVSSELGQGTKFQIKLVNA